MKLVDLENQYKLLERQIGRRISSILEHGQFISGPEVSELEEKLAQHCQVDHVIGVANGTDALQLALMALGVGPGDAVFVPTFTFFATAEAVAVVGATPVFVDVDERTFNLDPRSLEEAISLVIAKKSIIPKAVIAVDLFGLPANYEQIEKIAADNDLFIIEDGAQALGATVGERKACSFGDIATTSFFPAKPLGCYGDGGAVFTSDEGLAEILRSLHVHGKGAHKYDNVRIGLNSRLDSLQAGILLEKLTIFDGEIKRRQELAATYDQHLPNNLIKPQVPQGYNSAWAQYTIQVNGIERASVESKLKSARIPFAIYYAKPLHLQPAFVQLGYRVGMFPIAERLARTVVSLPIHPYLQERDISKIADALRFESNRSNCNR